MVELIGWLRARLRTDRALAVAAMLVLGIDLLLICLHIQRFFLRRMGITDHVLASQWLSLADDTGVGVIWVLLQHRIRFATRTRSMTTPPRVKTTAPSAYPEPARTWISR